MIVVAFCSLDSGGVQQVDVYTLKLFLCELSCVRFSFIYLNSDLGTQRAMSKFHQLLATVRSTWLNIFPCKAVTGH